MDDVMTHHVEKLVSVYNREVMEAGINHVLNMEDIKSWNISKYVVPEFKDKISEYFTRTGWFRYIKPRKDAQEVLERLCVDNEVHIVTAFVSEACIDKTGYIKEHFPFINAKNLIFCNNKHLIRADVLIDDGLHNIENFKGRPIVFDKPWNRCCDGRIARCHDWYEVEDYINNNM